MADTQRTEAELLAIFADGQGAGSITPQDIRDLVVSMYNAADDTLDLDERSSAPSLIAGKSRMYVSANGSLRIVTDDGIDRAISGPDASPVFRSFSTISAAAGTYYMGGFYDASAVDANLALGGSVAHGIATVTYGTHAFVVAGAVGTSDKTTGAVQLRVSGTSVTEGGVRTTGDSEVVVADIENGSIVTDTFLETDKKWVGQVTYTLENDGTGDATVATFDFNYGFNKSDDFGDRDFTIVDFDVVGLGGATDSGFDVELLHHSAAGWTYAAAGFVPGGDVVVQLSVDQATDIELRGGVHFAYKRTGLSTVVVGSGNGGIVIRVTTGANNSISLANSNIGVRL